MTQRIVISSGDINGIGPEVVLKSLSDSDYPEVTPVILGSESVIDFYADTLGKQIPLHRADTLDDVRANEINVLESYGSITPNITPGQLTKESGKCAMLAVEKALNLCKSGWADAMVTAPISKEAVNLAGYNIPGHTEFLADQTSTSNFMMMLVNDELRVGLVTTHIPLSEVPGSLSTRRIVDNIQIISNSLRNDFNISEPRIAVLGLNPHAGDGGIIGTEELEIIMPAIEQAKDNGIQVAGPLPADGFFGNRKYENFDGILATYHDQGLIPFKTLSFGKGVNFTAGLPVIRTSPDHGTAFDIAGQDMADPSSFKQAFSLAMNLAKNRTHQQQSA